MDWDPFNDSNDAVTITPQCLRRLKGDIKSLYMEPLDGLLIEHDESNFLRIHVLLIGPVGSPYEKGFFYFILGFPGDYPFSPPKVRLMTTGGGQVRFNPNLYANGKVCLSILGTYPGPEWTATQGVRSLLLNIQAIFCEKPYCNEPGFEEERNKGDIQSYNDMIAHETLRVAVLGMVNNKYHLTMPAKFVDFMQKQFLQNYAFHELYILENISKTGISMRDPIYNNEVGLFKFPELLDELEDIKRKLHLRQCQATDESKG